MTVTASNLNISAEELADRTAYTKARHLNTINVLNFGVVVGDSALNEAGNVAGFTAAIAALVALGKGELRLPTGIIRSTAEISFPAGVHLVSEGETVFKINHATANCVNVTSGGADEWTSIRGVTFEAAQANTGEVIRSFDSNGRVVLDNCKANISAALLHGPLAVSIGGITAFDCKLVSGYTGGLSITGGGLKTFGGELVLAPGATDDLIYCTETLLVGTVLTHVSTVGDVCFVGNGGGHSIRIIGCKGSRSGTGATYLTKVVAGTFMQVAANDVTQGGLTLYKLTSVPLTNGSDLQLLTEHAHAVISGHAYTLPDATASAYVSCTDALALDLTLPPIMFFGQSLDIAIQNKHGSGSWAGAPSFPTQGLDGSFFQSSGLSGLADAGVISMRWRALYFPTENVRRWVQIGAAGVLV